MPLWKKMSTTALPCTSIKSLQTCCCLLHTLEDQRLVVVVVGKSWLCCLLTCGQLHHDNTTVLYYSLAVKLLTKGIFLYYTLTITVYSFISTTVCFCYLAAVDFFNQINMLYGTITEMCTEDSCPVMSAGPKYEYHWADGQTVKKPIKCSAPKYIDYLMTWVQDQLDDETLFPSKIGEAVIMVVEWPFVQSV